MITISWGVDEAASRCSLGIRRCMKGNALCRCVVSVDMIHISAISVFCGRARKMIFSKQIDHVSAFSNFTGSDSACWCMKCSSAMPLLDLPRICCQFLCRSSSSWIIRPTSSSGFFLECYDTLKLVISRKGCRILMETLTSGNSRDQTRSKYMFLAGGPLPELLEMSSLIAARWSQFFFSPSIRAV